jgi:MoaA/NifB/PqqE/SkfB family radical SAM enzyme
VSKLFNILRNCFVKPNRPRHIWFGITEKCNSQCTNCNIWKQPWKDDELTPDEIFTIFSNPLFDKVDQVLISGGEPTVRKDLKECVLAIHKALPKAKLNISTNGLLTDYYISVVGELLDVGIPIQASTSLEGCKETHDSIRGKGSWDRVEKLIMMLLELRKIYGKDMLQIGVGTVLTDENADEIPRIVSIAEKLDLYYLIQWYNNSSFYNNLEDDAKREKERKVVESLDDLRFGMLKEKWLVYLDDKPIKFKCYALRDFLVIKANGDVVPCLSLWTWKIGNFKNDGVEKVWDGWLRQKALQTVSNCPGCLNSWGTYWSWEADGWPYIKYYLRHPRQLLSKVMKHDSDQQN